jgi:hypothetical protein
VDWRVSGTYLESCNCDAICPCRDINGIPGGRSTHGICLGALSWQIVDGHANEIDLSGLAVTLATRYSDDEEGSPWSWILYLDERGGAEEHRALEEIWTGRVPGDQISHFPWARKASHLLGVKPALIEVDHTPNRGWFRVKDVVSVRISGLYPGDETVTCGIPGHDRSGEEVIAEQLRVDDEGLRFEFSGVCGFVADFDYRSN